MKTSLRYYLLLALLLVGLGSCEKLTEGYDINPNAPQDAPADQQLTAVQVSEGFVLSGEMARTAGLFSDFFTGTDRQYEGLQNYTTVSGDYDNMWSNTFTLVLANARIVTQKAEAVQNFQLAGIAQVLEAQMIGMATSVWGDIPYSQALQPGQPAPFDRQSDIYASVQTLLSTAITNLGRTGINPQERDIYYGGDLAKWRAAAHSLKARFFLHVRNYPQAAAEARLGIASPAGDMLMPYGGTVSTSANPYYDFIDINRTGYMGAAGSYGVRLLEDLRNNARTNESARFEYFYTTEAGYSEVDPNILEGGAFAADADFPLITYVETQAILAEAQARANDLSGALAALNNIRAYNRTTFTGGTYAAYTLADFALGGLLNTGQSQQQALLREILTEKYLSLIGQIEPYNDVRRTNNLIGVPKKRTDAPSIPQRYLIAQNEVNANPNVPDPIPGLYEPTEVNR
ncbi:SusD/RagB family nutrient-binding outer membrane lipoprotein [Hymenobacter sp. BT188]|uniref:SusD/RagB family nutrient-binding outer membrane lipoprotein n=1 Tax=Hymenobacter sp. BT188 TaxID=2763504 RepID=UPI001651677D|nr:SusD/RagB family nutrient-binding outer membrane lipoprotein [Hymenobacter sp. BT188]MBC6607672.1 SusD/RagB family nutrient-binding outer membrane lipoprotein [Hymenobacter sp. BT188]